MEIKRKPMTVKEVAEYLGVHEATIRRWIQLKQIPATKMGKSYRIYKEDLQPVLDNGVVFSKPCQPEQTEVL